MKVAIFRDQGGSQFVSLCGFEEDTREQVLKRVPLGCELVEIISADTRQQQEALDVFGALAEFQRDQPDSLGAALETLLNKVFCAGYSFAKDR